MRHYNIGIEAGFKPSGGDLPAVPERKAGTGETRPASGKPMEKLNYSDATGIFLVRASSAFGRTILSTPFFTVARIFSLSTASGRVKTL